MQINSECYATLHCRPSVAKYDLYVCGVPLIPIDSASSGFSIPTSDHHLRLHRSLFQGLPHRSAILEELTTFDLVPWETEDLMSTKPFWGRQSPVQNTSSDEDCSIS